MKLDILDRLNIAKSEQWRWKWGFHTAVSIALMAFLALYPRTRQFLIHDGRHVIGPGFAGWVAVTVKDRMLGTTLINSWPVVLCAFVCCCICWALIVAMREATGSNGKIQDGVVLVIIFVLTMLLHTTEVPMQGKKFSFSFIPMIILEVNRGLHPRDIWWFFYDTLIGVACAIAGNLFPLPIDFSTADLQKRLRFCASSTTSLLTDLFKAWQYQSCFLDTTPGDPLAGHTGEELLSAEIPLAPVGEMSLLDRSRLLALRREAAAQRVPSWTNHYRARKRAHRRVVSMSAVPHAHSSDAGTVSSGASRRSSLRNSLRHVLFSFDEVQEIKMLPWRKIRRPRSGTKIRSWSDLASPENPHWRKLRLMLMAAIRLKCCRGKGLGWYFSNNSCGTKFLRIELTSFLREGINEISARIAESQFASISPLRRYLSVKYEKYASLLRDALNIASILEQKISAMEEAPELNYIYRAFHNVPAFRYALHQYVSALCASVEAIGDCLVACDKEQLHPAADRNPFVLHCATCTARLLAAQTAFDEVYYKCRLGLYYEPFDLSSNISNSPNSTQESHDHSTTVLPLNAEVLMNMNSFLFMANALCTLVTEFWTPAELIAVQNWQAQGPLLRQPSQSTWWASPSYAAMMALVPVAARDLFPKQRSVFTSLLPSATPEQREAAQARLRSAFTVALAITLGSAYGIYLKRTPPFLVPFTIAALTGGQAAGATVLTSLNRAAGTVVGCVWAIIVQQVVLNINGGAVDGALVQQQLIIGFAVVLPQIPATVLRSYPLQGYAGTCFCFTVCLILFAPLLGTDSTVNRIIDTFVGVVIYIIVESLILSYDTEDVLMHNMAKTFRAIHERFTGFEQNFLQYKRRMTIGNSQDGPPPMMTDIDLDAEDEDVGLRDLNVDPINRRIKVQKGLLAYAQMEPGLFRPPALPARLLEECVELQGQAVRHLQVMFWAVRAVAERSSPFSRSRRLRDKYKAIAAAACDPPNPALLPRREIARRKSSSSPGRESSHHRSSSPARDNSRRKSLSPSRESSRRKAASPVQSRKYSRSGKHSTVSPFGSEFSSAPGDSTRTPQYVTDSNSSDKSSSTASSAEPSPVLLLPLEQSLLEVGRYASLVVIFLEVCIRDIQLGLPVHAPLPQSRNTIDNLGERRSVRSSTDYHVEFLSHFASPEELRRVAGENELLAKLEAQNVIALLSRFQAVLALLIREVVESFTTTLMVQGVRARTPRHNKEVRVVNTMIASSVDLMRALRGLAVAVSTLRAHRDIHITQTGTKFL
jgi:uncharacterized membrane protein YgaE (UPF0421/DUF939 family)